MSPPDTPGTRALDAIADAAGAANLFADLDEGGRAAVEDEAEWVALPGGATLFRQGDPGDALYVILTGRVRVLVDSDDGTPRAVAEIGRGESVGEMALLTGEPRSATIVAIRDTQLLKLSRRAFERIVERSPRVMLVVTRRLVHRLQQMNRDGGRAKRIISTIAVMPAGAGVELPAFIAEFAAALGAPGTVALVTRERAERDGGRDDGSLAAWLDRLEREFRYVVYAADPADAAWNARCARQADRVLLVGRGGRDSGVGDGPMADAMRQGTARRELVLVYRAGESPADSAGKIEACGAAAHHHLREGSAGDLHRLVRLLTGRGVGLVLGGGGARGFAHIGVIEALRDAGVPIDAIGGTSMGAVIAAQHASGIDPASLRALNREHWAKRNPLKDKTLPVVALLAGHRLERMIERMFGDRRIEDLWTRYFCVSADLTHAQMRVHERGALGRAVRASMSLPGIAIPVYDNGSMLVDGGLLNNLPADVMHEVCGRVIAVDVSPAKDLAISAPYPPAASGWRLLWGRGASKLPGIGAILMRSVLLGSTRHQQATASAVDLYLHPPLEGYGMFEWAAVDAIADAGRAFARDALAGSPSAFTE